MNKKGEADTSPFFAINWGIDLSRFCIVLNMGIIRKNRVAAARRVS